MTYKLRGLPEGLVGQSQVDADSLDELVKSYPQLEQVVDKLQVDGGAVHAYTPCDG